MDSYAYTNAHTQTVEHEKKHRQLVHPNQHSSTQQTFLHVRNTHRIHRIVSIACTYFILFTRIYVFTMFICYMKVDKNKTMPVFHVSNAVAVVCARHIATATATTRANTVGVQQSITDLCGGRARRLYEQKHKTGLLVSSLGCDGCGWFVVFVVCEFSVALC